MSSTRRARLVPRFDARYTDVRSHNSIDGRHMYISVSQSDAKHTTYVRYYFISLVSTNRLLATIVSLPHYDVGPICFL